MTTTHSTMGATPDDEDGDDVDGAVWGPNLSWPKLAVLLAAFGFLAGAVGLVIAQDRPPGAESVSAGFYLDMIRHHEQAVEMSLIELGGGEDATVRAFAQEVVIFQQYEIGLMEQRLRDWGIDRGGERDIAMKWMDMPVAIDSMPGLATNDQMNRLEQAEGTARDTIFLDLMAEHHRGGAHMSAFAVEHADDRFVKELAEQMFRNQSIEIREYRQTAERLGLDVAIESYDHNADPFGQPGG
ncbi:MAG: DUF305 domain-containing protein [Acidimicrobiales bacterium]